MRYRLAALATALVLAGTGLWLATVHASSYMQIMNTDGYTRRVIQVNGNGIPELHLCNDVMCVPYGEIRQQYMGYFAIDAAMFSASMGLVVILFVLRRSMQAKSIA